MKNRLAPSNVLQSPITHDHSIAKQLMPFLTFHRPSFVKNLPALNALTHKGAREADGAIDTSQAVRTKSPHRSFFGQYRARVAVLRGMARHPTLPTATSTAPVPADEIAQIPDSAQQPLPPILTLPTEILDLIIKNAAVDDNMIRVVTQLRCLNIALKDFVDDYLRRPEQGELALRMTRNSITNLARTPQLTDQQFKAQARRLIDRNTHIGVGLSLIASRDKRQIILDCLANATHLCTVDLDAHHTPESFEAVLAATNAMSAGNPLLKQFALNVSFNHIDAAGAQALAANSTITELNVSDNLINAAGAQALAANTSITRLNLCDNNIGDAGAQALAENSTITELNLYGNHVNTAGAQALAANTAITQLNLCENGIGDAGAQALAENNSITQLNLSNNAISDAGMRAMAANKTVTRLDVSYNNIGPAGAQALAANSTITELNISNNHISAAGAQGLARNNTITQLNVSYNALGDAGVQALAANTTITALNVDNNGIGPLAARALLRRLSIHT